MSAMLLARGARRAAGLATMTARPLSVLHPAVAQAREDSAASLGVKLAGAGIVAAGVGMGLHSSAAQCHGSDNARLARLEEQVATLTAQLQAQHDVQTTTGQGDAVFEWDVDLTSAFPADAKAFEKDLHGGFNEDPDTGVVYTGIPGYGLCQISPDLKTWKRIGSDPRLKDNCHGIVVFKHKGTTQIAVAQNEQARILIIGLDGAVKQELKQPKGGEFNYDEANWYYSHTPKKQCPWGTPHTPAFAVTDVTYHNGKLYAVAGYCDGDFVVTATEKNGTWTWGPIAWGGRGDEPGRFQTAHGIFAYDNHIFVANRENHQVIEFTPEGKLVRCLPDIPDTARICNIARADNYFVFNALEPIQHTPAKTAPIYAHSGERLLSTIEPGDLGIPVLKHLHHVWPHYVTDPKTKKRTLYLLVQGWSRGKFAVLKHVPGGKPSTPNGWNRTQEPL